MNKTLFKNNYCRNYLLLIDYFWKVNFIKETNQKKTDELHLKTFSKSQQSAILDEFYSLDNY